MHKTFCASGFLYHLPSKRILLQNQSDQATLSSSWSLFGGIHAEKENPKTVFKKVILDLLDIKIDSVNLVYSYFSENTNANKVIVYSELKNIKNFPSNEIAAFEWFSFKDVLKLQIAERTKHDIVVGQRVIDAAERKSNGEHTFQ